jgi:hypothetical protein
LIPRVFHLRKRLGEYQALSSSPNRHISEAINSLEPANSQNRERRVTIARKTDIFLGVSLRRLASAGRFRRPADDGPRTKDRIKMSDRPSHNLGGLDIDMARRIDEVCRRLDIHRTVRGSAAVSES